MFPKMISKLTCFLMLFTVIACSITMPVHCDTPAVSAPSAILMEASTGTVIYEKEADTKLRPASITKIMTLILILTLLRKTK